MRRYVSLSVALLVAGSLQSALAQGFAGALVAGGQQYEIWVERDGPYAILWLGQEVYMLEPATMPAGQ
jgi:hypothetical protein